MRYRFVAIGLITPLILVGAIHYPPLWFFVVVAPLWLDLAFTWEEERIRREILQELDGYAPRRHGDTER